MPITGYKVIAKQQNLILYSEQFDYSNNWDNTTFPCTITKQSAISGPYPNMTVYSIISTNGSISLINQIDCSINVVGTSIQYCSVYAKEYTSTSFTLNCYYSGDTEVNTTFNLNTGTITSGSGTILPVGNGWYRCSIQVPARVNSGTNFWWRIWPEARENYTGIGCYFSGAYLSNIEVGQYVKTESEIINNNLVDKPDLGDLLVPKEYFMEGNLWGWGYNNVGQLGDNSTTSKSSPIQTISNGINWKLVSCGYYHTTAIKTDGTLWSWGYNANGHLGDNTTTNKSSPVQTVSGTVTWKLTNSGNNHTAAIKTDGSLWMWGRNTDGQLGDNTVANKSSPVQTVSGGTNWISVNCGNIFCVAIKTDNTLWSWGKNDTGQLGDNSTTSKSSPIQTVAGGTDWKFVSAGNTHTVAIKTDGTLWCWGQNTYGQLGNNTTTNKSSPVQTISGGTNWKLVGSGGSFTSAIKTNGTLWCWGRNGVGQLGDNSTTNKSSPVQTISGGTNWKTSSCGDNFTSAIKTDGTLWVWGYNNNGQLGDNTTINKSSPTQTVSGGTNWRVTGSLNGPHVFAIKEN